MYRGSARKRNRVEDENQSNDIQNGVNFQNGAHNQNAHNHNKNEHNKSKKEESQATIYSQYTTYTEYLESLHKEHDENQENSEDKWEIVYCLMRILVIVIPITITIMCIPLYLNCNGNTSMSRRDKEIRICIGLLQPFFSITLSILIATFTQPKQALNAPVDITQKRDHRASTETTQTGYDYEKMSRLDDEGIEGDDDEADLSKPPKQDFRTLARALARAKALYRTNKENNADNFNINADPEDDAVPASKNGAAPGDTGTGVAVMIEDKSSAVDASQNNFAVNVHIDVSSTVFRDEVTVSTNSNFNALSSESLQGFSNEAFMKSFNKTARNNLSEAEEGSLKEDKSAGGILKRRTSNKVEPGTGDGNEAEAEQAKTEEAAPAKSSYKKPAIVLVMFFSVWISLGMALLGVFHFGKGC